MPQAVSLRGDQWWDPGLPRHLRRRGARALGPLGYAFLLGRSAEEHHRLTLIEGDRTLAAAPAASAHHRRLVAWDAVSQAALAAEDLEMLITAGERWQSDQRRDFFREFSAVDAAGPAYFQISPLGWQLRLARTIALPSKQALRACLSAPQATLLLGGMENSVKQATDDLDVVANQITAPIRGAMLRYKHGFASFPLEHVAVPTDSFGAGRMAAASNGFLVWTRQSTALVFEGTLAEIERARAMATAIARLDHFICDLLLTQAGHPQARWGVGLYGTSAVDAALTDLVAAVTEFIQRP